MGLGYYEKAARLFLHLEAQHAEACSEVGRKAAIHLFPVHIADLFHFSTCFFLVHTADLLHFPRHLDRVTCRHRPVRHLLLPRILPALQAQDARRRPRVVSRIHGPRAALEGVARCVLELRLQEGARRHGQVEREWRRVRV